MQEREGVMGMEGERGGGGGVKCVLGRKFEGGKGEEKREEERGKGEIGGKEESRKRGW